MPSVVEKEMKGEKVAFQELGLLGVPSTKFLHETHKSYQRSERKIIY